MSINYEKLLNKEFGIVDKKSKIGRADSSDKLYKKFNPSKGVGKSIKGLRIIPKEILEMSVWD